MKNTFRVVTLVTVLNANTVFAASGAEATGFSLMGWIFIGFMALVVTLQFVPCLMMFGSLLVGVFGKTAKKAEVTANGEAVNS